jgi:hypothetical protein
LTFKFFSFENFCSASAQKSKVYFAARFLKKRVQTLEMSEEAKDPLESLDPDDMEDLVTFFC